MKLIYLKKASDYEVEKWLEKKLDLSPYQREKMRDHEIVRFSMFSFYVKETSEDREKKKKNFLWRVTLIFWFIYVLLLILVALPLKWIVTGNWGLQPGKFVENFHKPWARKLGL